MTIILFDDDAHKSLQPLTFTRPVADLRIGILTIAEKWAKQLNASHSFFTDSYLQHKFPLVLSAKNIFINGSVCPDETLLAQIILLKEGEYLSSDKTVIAINLAEADAKTFTLNQIDQFKNLAFKGSFNRVQFPEDIFRLNDQELKKDFDLLTQNRSSQNISNTNTIIGDNFFAEEGVKAECSTFNTQNGPIFLGKDSEVWEGCNIRGALALCNNSQIKMAAKIYGATTIGPFSRVGGEINNAVIWGNSSKGHDGYLGNSVLGEWCNIGADSNNSNLKNNYAEVRLWDYRTEHFRKTGLQFCGLIMADHAKCGINTMFNTGTVVGVGANVFGAGFPRNFIPDFAWGGAHGFETYSLQKMFETTEKVFERRNKDFNAVEQQILENVFKNTEKFRRF